MSWACGYRSTITSQRIDVRAVSPETYPLAIIMQFVYIVVTQVQQARLRPLAVYHVRHKSAGMPAACITKVSTFLYLRGNVFNWQESAVVRSNICLVSGDEQLRPRRSCVLHPCGNDQCRYELEMRALRISEGNASGLQLSVTLATKRGD